VGYWYSTRPATTKTAKPIRMLLIVVKKPKMGLIIKPKMLVVFIPFLFYKLEK
jgi:hypothetical protein